MSVALYFDPGCPWTWLTSRWLVQESERHGFDIAWRSFSLAHVNRDKEVPEELQAPIAAAAVAHRMFERLRQADGGNAAVGSFYEALGRATHSVDEPLSVEIVEAVASALGLAPEVLAAAGDESLDAAVAASTEEAVSLCGGEAGSPVLSIRQGKAINGPIIDSLPSVGRGDRLWEAMVALTGVSSFCEVKRARTGPPQTKGT